MNQFAEKAPRYDYVSMAATSVLGGDSVKALGQQEGRRLGGEGYVHAIPEPSCPFPYPQQEPKRGLEFGVNKGKAESAEAFSLSQLVVFPYLVCDRHALNLHMASLI